MARPSAVHRARALSHLSQVYTARRAPHRHIFKRLLLLLEIDLAHLRQVGRPVKVVAIWHDMTSPERAVIRNVFLYSFCSKAALCWALGASRIHICTQKSIYKRSEGDKTFGYGAWCSRGAERVFLWRPAAMLDVRGSSERVDRPTHCSSQSWSAARLILFNEARLHSAVSCSCFIIINDSASGDHLFARLLCSCRFFTTLVIWLGAVSVQNYVALWHFPVSRARYYSFSGF